MHKTLPSEVEPQSVSELADDCRSLLANPAELPVARHALRFHDAARAFLRDAPEGLSERAAALQETARTLLREVPEELSERATALHEAARTFLREATPPEIPERATAMIEGLSEYGEGLRRHLRRKRPESAE